MVPGQRRAGKVVEAPSACFAAIPLPMGLGVVVPVADHRITATPETAHALRPAKLAHQREALGVVQQPREVDQVGCRHDRSAVLLLGFWATVMRFGSGWEGSGGRLSPMGLGAA